MVRTAVRAHARRGSRGVRAHSRVVFGPGMKNQTKAFLDAAASAKLQAWLDKHFPGYHLKGEVHVNWDANHDYSKSLGELDGTVRVTGPLGIEVMSAKFKVDPKHRIEGTVHMSVPYVFAEKKIRSYLEDGM